MTKLRMKETLVGYAVGRSRNFIINGVRFAVLKDGAGVLFVTLAHELDEYPPAPIEGPDVDKLAEATKALLSLPDLVAERLRKT